jgi:hypothetical protein
MGNGDGARPVWSTRRQELVLFLRGVTVRVAGRVAVVVDAADVAPAWEAMQHGEDNTDPRIAATQQRLQACSYAMAHPETGQLVPVSARASGL